MRVQAIGKDFSALEVSEAEYSRAADIEVTPCTDEDLKAMEITPEEYASYFHWIGGIENLHHTLDIAGGNPCVEKLGFKQGDRKLTGSETGEFFFVDFGSIQSADILKKDRVKSTYNRHKCSEWSASGQKSGQKFE